MSRRICSSLAKSSKRDIAEIVEAVCGTVALPVAVKLTPYLSSIGHFAEQLVGRGAAGLVLFNRLLEPDIDLLRHEADGPVGAERA